MKALRHQVSGRTHAILWVLASILAAAAVWRLQISNRAPLVWDEAARVDAGATFAHAVATGDLLGVWHWINQQFYYPFLGPVLNGLVLQITNNALAAAWVPSLAAYAFAGILAGRLATELGSRGIGAWAAGVMTWLAPIFARDAGGAWTEPIGACVLLGLLIAITRMNGHFSPRAPFMAGLLAASAWFIKFDYGLLALGTIGISGIVAVALPGRRFQRFKQYLVAGVAAIGLIGAWFLVDPITKFNGVFHYVRQQFQIDFSYYIRALFSGGEVGLADLIALMFVASVLVAAFHIRRPEVRAPLICLGLWYLEYSVATYRYPRYLGTIVPLLAVFAGFAIGELVKLVQRAHLRSPFQRQVVLWALTVVVSVQLILQAGASGTGLSTQFWFLVPDSAASEALSFASTHLRIDSSAVLMLGQTNELSPAALHLAWTERLGRPAPAVDTIPETGRSGTRESLIAAIEAIGDGEVIAVDVRPGSRLDTPDYRTTFPSQPEYVTLARQLESEKLLRVVANTSLEGGRLGVTIWELGSSVALRT